MIFGNMTRQAIAGSVKRISRVVPAVVLRVQYWRRRYCFGVGTGFCGNFRDWRPWGMYKNDCWKYDTLAGNWTQIANFGTAGRVGAIGCRSVAVKDIWVWEQMRSFPRLLGNLTDLWEYDTLAELVPESQLPCRRLK